MKQIETDLPGVVLLEPSVMEDARGLFFESYNQREFAKFGIAHPFVQDNHSKSKKDTLRGLHYQINNPQAKLCRVVAGEVLDVVVDLRQSSPYRWRHLKTVLSATNRRQIYIPPGFAHGFLVLSETAEFLYKCSDFYVREDERGVRWSDPALGIEWGVEGPMLSEKDGRLPLLADIPLNDLPRVTFHTHR